MANHTWHPGQSRIRRSGDGSVLALLGPELRQRLSTRMSEATMCETWEDLSRALEHSGPTILFLDPALGDGFASRTQAIRERYPLAAVVLYTQVKPPLIKLSLPLFRAGVSDMVLAGFDDTAERLASLLTEIQTRGLSEPLLDMIAGVVDRLPKALRSAVVAMFAEPTKVRSVGDLARIAGTSRRRVFRAVKTAGFESARLLVASARVSAACRLLVQSGRTVADTAAMLQYSSADRLCEHFLAVVGRTPREVKAMLSVDEAYQLIAPRLVRGQLGHTSFDHRLSQEFAESGAGNS